MSGGISGKQGDRGACIASKLAPTGPVSNHNVVYDRERVGAGLPAMNDNVDYLPCAVRIRSTGTALPASRS